MVQACPASTTRRVLLMGTAMYHGCTAGPYRQGLTLARDGLARGFGHMG